MKAAFPTGTGGDAATEFVPPRPEELAPHFPQLEILECLGRGGMGVVYKARQKTLNRFVALKLLAPERVKEAQFADRFLREAQALARLNHPNIVTVYDFGESGGLFFLLMEYMDGLNLRELLRARKIEPTEALSIVPRICEALQYAHDQGIVHRDIKPENILLDKQGRVKIADFGIAKLLGQDAPFTQEEQVIGTPHYMAPEQTEKPLQVDHRADIYSLGVVFYEMLTGELPLGKFQPPSQKVQVDVRLDEVVLRALEKEPERRYQTARGLKTQLETIAATPPVANAAGLHAPGELPRRRINWLPALVFYALADVVWVGASLVAAAGNGGTALLAYLFALPFWAASTLLWAILHYSCWQALPPRYRTVTPERAVGFMFIPVFNWYWVFISYPQLAEGFNALRADRRDLPIKDARGLAIASGVVFVLCWSLVWLVPLTALLVAIADLLLFALFFHTIVANANASIDAAQGTRPSSTVLGWPGVAVGSVVTTICSIPIGLGALVWLLGILLDSSWNPGTGELVFSLALFGLALVAVTASVAFGVITLRKIRQTPGLPGRPAALAALLTWPCLLVLAAVAYFGYGHWVTRVKARAEAEQRAVHASHLQALAPLPGAGQSVPADAIVERTLNERDSRAGEEALSLRTGRLVSFGGADLKKPADLQVWYRTNLVDLMVSFTHKRWSLVTMKKDGLKLADFPNDRWENASAVDITGALAGDSAFPRSVNGAASVLTLPQTPVLPLTFAFRTRDGSEGLLQIMGLDEDSARLSLRYRFLKTTKW